MKILISTFGVRGVITPYAPNDQPACASFVLCWRRSQTERDATGMHALLAELAWVVDETLQPKHVSVWLRKH
jgi:hypothetical protein